MKTQAQIAEKYKALTDSPDDFFGFFRQVLIGFLDFEHGKPFAKGMTAEAWNKTTMPLTREAVLVSMRDYMAFAWDKVENHRGLSAGRSVSKMEAYLWILGDDATTKLVEKAAYENYGAPKLKVICEAYNLPMPESGPLQRMMRGETCGSGDDCGCGG